MKKTCLAVFFTLAIFAETFGLDASVSYATFKSPTQNYIEIYLHVVAQTVEFKVVDSVQRQSNIEVIILFKQEDKIVKFDKFTLNSPISKHPVDFVDLKRYGLENGQYELSVSVNDLNREGNNKTYKTQVTMDYGDAAFQLSDIQLLSSIEKSDGSGPLTKNGYLMEPLPFNFYHRNASRLIFYTEVYQNTAEVSGEEQFLVRYTVEALRGGQGGTTVMIGNQKMTARPVNVMLAQKDISKLPSGNYRLRVEVRNRGMELLCQKTVDFQRSNPYLSEEGIALADINSEFVRQLDTEELRYGLKAIAPIVKDANVEILNMVIANKDDLEAQRRFLFSFWADKNPNDPQKAYDDYMAVAKAIDEKFQSGFGYGFETDRGWTFMKYGMPDDVVSVEDDPSAPPYEIWSYYDFPLTNQSNVKFLFYNPSLAHNDFELLHSNALGELNDPQWQLKLYRKAPDQIEGSNHFDGTRMQDNWNRHAARLLNDF